MICLRLHKKVDRKGLFEGKVNVIGTLYDQLTMSSKSFIRKKC